ncbi:hypothetical protein [Hahella sp. HN01]|uniref:hypothetical protein n=1 Tax=Hahella sp. HN01 TaxID=2847262 RepID=UPI001C1EBB87|nr:hypothetical protein [Hahella sp. HN01]MBU6952748.1 hypothetical protein [Hahella sp. HN01]
MSTKLRALFTQFIEWLPDQVIALTGEIMRGFMVSVGGMFFYLYHTGELQKLSHHLLVNKWDSDPMAFFLAGVFALLAYQMLQFKRVYEGCRETLAVRRYCRTGRLPYSF